MQDPRHDHDASDPHQEKVAPPPAKLPQEELGAWCDRFMENPAFIAWLRRGHELFGVSGAEVFDDLLVWIDTEGEVEYEPRYG